MTDARPMPEPATEQGQRPFLFNCERLPVAPHRSAVAIVCHSSEAVKESEVLLLFGQSRNEVAECCEDREADTPAVAVESTKADALADQRAIADTLAGEAQHCF